MNDFGYISVLLDMLYGIEMNSEDIEELGLIAWNLIGNKDMRLYKIQLAIDSTDNSVTLPCNFILGESQIEAVTAGYEDWSYVTNYSENGDHLTAFIENSIEAEKYYRSPYYISGKLLKYHQSGNKLYFSSNYGTVNILYKGVLMDDEGLPKLTDKEATAIASYIAYVVKFKEGLQTNNTNIINQSYEIKKIWLQQCDQARVKYLNQNDMNNILEVKNSFDRATYGRSYKPIR